MSFNTQFSRVIDWFIPGELLADREMRTRARMFLFSHMFGPILGNVIPGYLLWADPGSKSRLAVLAVSICCFWIFPFLLKYTGRYTLLSHISVQNLLFAILWGCYFYGGLSSPFLPWLVTVPLLAFFYLGASLRSCTTILLQISLSIAAFIAQFAFGGQLPRTIELSDMQGIGIISIISASIYVSMMALYYAGILASQTDLEKEVSRHLATADQLRKAASQAERASAAKAEFLARMSHELRTPLNAVIGYSEMLLEDCDPDGDPQGIGDLKKIHTAGRHLLGLVNAILDLSKIEAGKMEVFLDAVDVAALLEKVAARCRANLQLRGRNIKVSVDGEIGIIDADFSKLEQVLEALIENAIRYAPNSDVEIAARATTAAAPSEDIEISVRDRGPGIPTPLLPTLFETFNDFEDASTTKYGGAGLGLPLSYRLCQLMHGRLCVRTAADGTTVTVTLPRQATVSTPAVSTIGDLAEAA